jgi:hypothetical protein
MAQKYRDGTEIRIYAFLSLAHSGLDLSLYQFHRKAADFKV